MKPALYIMLMSLLAAFHGCSDAEFAGNNQAVRSSKKPPPLQPPVDKSPPTGDQTLVVEDGGKITACVRGKDPVPFDFSIARHKDTVTFYKDVMPKSDVEQSPVQKFNASSIAGDLLPVTDFALDDVAFIVKESDQFQREGRTITIPDHALIIKDGLNPAGASGRIDSAQNTVYIYKGQRRTITSQKQNLADALNNIASMGISPIPHNQIKISQMREKGFIDANGDVAFKVVHVAHGHGFLRMKYTLQPCK